MVWSREHGLEEPRISDNFFYMSDKKQQETATDSKTGEEGAEDRPLWEYLERAERRSNEPMFYELAETLVDSRLQKSGCDFVN